MIFRTTTGFVLTCSDFSETSKIVTIYTRDFGKVRAIAKGARRKKSEFLGILNPLSLLEVVYIEKKGGLHILKEAFVLDSGLTLRDRLSKIARGLHFLSLVERTQADEDADRAVFDLLKSSLSALHSASPENASMVFQLRLLEKLGRLPSLAACGRCASPLKGGVFFDSRWGYLLCNPCGKNLKRSLSAGTLQVLRRLAESSFERCGRVKLSKEQSAEIVPVIRAMLRMAMEAELPAEKVVDSLLT